MNTRADDRALLELISKIVEGFDLKPFEFKDVVIKLSDGTLNKGQLNHDQHHWFLIDSNYSARLFINPHMVVSIALQEDFE